MLEKAANQDRWWVNHRIGLFDMILKDNHVDFAGGIDKAIQRAQNLLQGEKGKDLDWNWSP